MIHSADEAESSVDTLLGILNGSAGIPLSGSSGGGNTISNVLTFNEPDGDTSSGGTSSTPQSAAKIWLETLSLLRSGPYNLKLSLPATTGSPRGLDWLKQFNTSCYSLNKTHGCEFDFIATHWYGDFASMQSWLSQIHALYPSQKIWLTEFDIPSVSDDDTAQFMNQSLPYLDGLDYVERYAWFGAFRENNANGWTGDAVSLFDKKGKLTGLGATWMGGQEDGFGEGTSATGGNDNAAGVVGWNMWLAVLAAATVMIMDAW
jgi:hypothetical protein